MTAKTAISRASIAAAIALLAGILRLFGVELPAGLAEQLVDLGTIAVPLLIAGYLAVKGHKAARPTEGVTPSDPGGTAEDAPETAPAPLALD